MALAAVTIHFAIISDAPLPDHRLVSGYNDLLLHASAFGALALVAIPAFRRPTQTLVGLSGFATLLEAAQLVLPARNADWADLGASISGICLGCLMFTIARRLCSTIPVWYGKLR